MSNVSKQGRARAPVIARVPASSDSVVSHGRRGRQPRSAAMPGAAGGDASNAGGGRGGEDAYVPVTGRAGRGRRSFMLGPQSNEDAAPASSFAAPSQNKAKSLPVLTTSRTSWEVANTLLGRRASPRVDLDFQQQQQQRPVLSLEEELADEEEIQVRERCASFSRVPNLHGTSKETTLSKAITSSGVRQQPARSPSPTQAQAPALGAGDYDPSMGRGRPGRLQTTWEKLLLRQCLLNKVDLVEKTIDSGKIGPNFEFFNGETALIIACKRGYKKLAVSLPPQRAVSDRYWLACRAFANACVPWLAASPRSPSRTYEPADLHAIGRRSKPSCIAVQTWISGTPTAIQLRTGPLRWVSMTWRTCSSRTAPTTEL